MNSEQQVAPTPGKRRRRIWRVPLLLLLLLLVGVFFVLDPLLEKAIEGVAQRMGGSYTEAVVMSLEPAAK